MKKSKTKQKKNVSRTPPKQVAIVKRHGHTENYDEKKVYASCFAAALNCHYSEQEAERIALETLGKVNVWVVARELVSAEEIRQHIISSLPDEDVALMYRHHLDLC